MRTFFTFLLLCTSLSAATIYKQTGDEAFSPLGRNFQAYAQSVTVTEPTEIEQIWILLNRDDIDDSDGVSPSLLPTFYHWVLDEDDSRFHLKPEASWKPTMTRVPTSDIDFLRPMRADQARWLGARPGLESGNPYVIDPGEHFFGVMARGELDDFTGSVVGTDLLIEGLGQFYVRGTSTWYDIPTNDPDSIKALAMVINDVPFALPEPSTAVLALLALPCLWRKRSTTNGIGEQLNC